MLGMLVDHLRNQPLKSRFHLARRAKSAHLGKRSGLGDDGQPLLLSREFAIMRVSDSLMANVPDRQRRAITQQPSRGQEPRRDSRTPHASLRGA